MNLLHSFEAIHASVTRRWWMQLFAAFVRCLLALGFIPPSIPRILGIPFTSLSESTDIGAFFNTLLKTGFYSEFIGWSRLAAALLFLPIIVNITVLTISLGFAGTWVITILMSLANLFLVLWEYDRLKQVVLGTRIERPRRFRFEFLWFPAIFGLGGVLSGLLAWSIGLGNFGNYPAVTGFLAALGAIFGLVVTAHYRFMPVGSMKVDDPTG